ncbi:variable surface lipoprotein [Mycoplasmopsis bovis]|nr:variable surface lipoprotein [Mycoplasmopsis bovis]QQH48945.1 variable surface lipoprotein [Mycoplasmopsis bovis]
MKKTNKIIISLSSIISISSMPLIADYHVQNKNPTDESIINNITPQKNYKIIKSNKKIRVKKKNLMVLVILLQDTDPTNSR